MPISWEPSMATGIARIDDQHRTLVDTLNYVTHTLASDMTPGDLQSILDWLGNYADSHFLFEEACMDRYRCPRAAENRAAHKQFRDLFQEVREQQAQGIDTRELGILIEQRLSNWLLDHLCGVDSALGKCVRQAAPGTH
jgi:hemerythrin